MSAPIPAPVAPRAALSAAALIALALAAIAAPAWAATTSELTQYGITWTFAEPVTYGQFAGGDYWVIGPVQITSIDPPSAEVDGRTKNGSMLNPGLGMTQGYDSAMYGNYGPAYSADLNVALGVSAASPLTVPPGSSLISSISIDAAGNRPQLKTAAVLTVLSLAPSEGSFRPPYFGTDKTVRYNVSQLDYSKLPRLAPVAGAPTPASQAGNFQRPWLEHVLSWTGRYCHPADNMPDYGRDMANRIGNAAMALLLDYPDAEKRDLLVNLVQYGIDLYAIAQGGGTWEDLGGHMHGRKLPIMLAGLVLGQAEMVAIGTTMPNRFQEDRQTWIVTEDDVGRPLYHGDGRPREEYIEEDVGIPEWGEQHFRQPSRDGRNWNAYYRTNVGHSILPHVLAANILDLREAWNWEPLFLYIDRYWEIEKDRTSGSDRIGTFARNMWTAYRDHVHEPAVPFSVTGWTLDAAHGSAGWLGAPAADGTVEPRAGVTRVTVTFSEAVDPATVAPGAVTLVGQNAGDLSSQIAALSVGADNRTVHVELASALPDTDRYAAAVTSAVRNVTGDSVEGDADLAFAVLVGDVDGSGTVAEADVVAARAQAGAANTDSARFDVDCSGESSGADLVLIRQRIGNTLP